jgi:predicted nucleic acid-binding protein
VLLIDTSVVIYLLIERDHSVSAQELWRRDPDWRSEALLLVELTNVLAASIATNWMTSALAEDILAKAITLLDGKLVRIAHTSVLSVAVRYRVTLTTRAFSPLRNSSAPAL